MKTYKFKLYSNQGNRELHKTIERHASVTDFFHPLRLARFVVIQLDRDRNAAVNIHEVGASTFAGEAIRPTSVGSLCR